VEAEAGFDFSSDHSPVLVTMHTRLAQSSKPPTLTTNRTNWATFKQYIQDNLTLQVPLKTNRDTEDYVHHFTQTIQQVACTSTPTPPKHLKQNSCPPAIMQKIIDKRILRRRWQLTRFPRDKANMNRATSELKSLLLEYKQQAIRSYLENLSPTKATDYSLWKVTKRLQRPQTLIPPFRTPEGGWAKSDPQKAPALADHFEYVFHPHADNPTGNDTQDTLPSTVPTPPASTIKKFTVTEVREALSNLRHTKAPGYYLINGLTLKRLPDVGLSAIVYIYNGILRTGYFPGQWKVSQIIPIHKHADDIKSYGPISLLSILQNIRETPYSQTTTYLAPHSNTT
jgi:hypothetical protein